MISRTAATRPHRAGATFVAIVLFAAVLLFAILLSLRYAHGATDSTPAAMATDRSAGLTR